MTNFSSHAILCALSSQLAVAFLPPNCSTYAHSCPMQGANAMDWTPLIPYWLDLDPSVIAGASDHESPQLAKDMDYATAVQEYWRDEVAQRSDHQHDDYSCESSHLVYADENGTPLYGHIVRRKGPVATKIPGIVLFHTGAGPHDIFLHWKADSLVSNRQVFPEGCIVLIADIFSDGSGWAWSPDRTRYNQVREYVLSTDEKTGARLPLQTRIQAAIKALLSQPEVDSTRLGAMGWCFGGHSILELGRMRHPGMRAMVTFHGVFDGIPPPPYELANIGLSTNDCDNGDCHVLICNGMEDPFVSQISLDAAIATLVHRKAEVEILSLEGARHGFTNPAQDFNSNPQFRFYEEAATKSWSAALCLLQSKLAKRP